MISEKLRSFRLENGLNQERLAEKIGVSRQTISNWENDRRVPDIYSLVALSDLYGVSLDGLIKGDAKVMAMLSGSTKVVGERYLYGAVALNGLGMIELFYFEQLGILPKVAFMISHFTAILLLMYYFFPYYKEELKLIKEDEGSKTSGFSMRVFYWFTLIATLSVLFLNFFYSIGLKVTLIGDFFA